MAALEPGVTGISVSEAIRMLDLLVDIDLDFFFGPPVYHPGECHPEYFKPWISPQDFMRHIAAIGIKMPPLEVSGMVDHREAYFCWEQARCRDAIVVHFDAHSDCYPSFPEIIHCGNYLRKAIINGIIRRAVWVLPSWFYRNPGHPVAFDALGSIAKGVYDGLPLTVTPLAGLSIAKFSFSETVPETVPRLVTLAFSPSYVPESAFESHFVPLAEALGIDHPGMPSAA